MTAVVQGAVIYGIEKLRHTNVKFMSAVTKSYGINIRGRFQWLVRNGDMVLSTEKKSIYSNEFWITPNSSPIRKLDVGVFLFLARDQYDDDVPKEWEDGQYGTLSCERSTI